MTSPVISQGMPQARGFGEDPLTEFSRLFVRFLQLVFETFPKGSYRWNKDEKLTDLIISDQATIGREVVERRPAIIVSRGAASFANVSMDQFAGPLLDEQKDGTIKFTPNEDPSKGSRRYTDLISSTMTYNCLSREGLEAQRIAWIAAYATRTLKRALLKAGLHRVGEDLAIGAESSPGSIVQPDSNEIIMVSVNVPFYFQDTWTNSPLDKTLLTKVSLALSSDGRVGDPKDPSAAEPSIYGNTLGQRVLTLSSQVLAGPWKPPKPLKK